MKRTAWSVGLALLAGCAPADGPRDAPRFDASPAPGSGSEGYTADGPFVFRDVTEEAGLGGFRQVNGAAEKPFIVETVGGGVALLDADGDGDLDAYLTNGGRLGAPEADNPSDALFANDGAGRFVDVTVAAGVDERRWSNGVRTVDLDADGRTDLYVTNYGPNTFWRNAGDGRFEDATEELGVGDPRWSTGACFLDVERDGDLDLYVANYVDFDEAWMLANRPRTDYRGVSVMKGPRGLPGAADAFLVNGGGGRMEDATERFGLAGPKRFAFQCVAFDADQDGWVDVYVANDSVANSLWMNRGGERFEDRAMVAGAAFSMSGKPQAGMGVALGDYDDDGHADLFVTNFADDYFTVYRGQGRGFFLDRTPRLGLGEPTTAMLGWGCGFVDFDADGDLELFAVNGHVYPQVDAFDLGTRYRQPNQLFELVDGAYREPPGRGGPGFALAAASRGAATGDVDGDGDVDLLVGNIDGPPTLLRNDGPQGGSVHVRLVGARGNRDAVGARVAARVGDATRWRWAGTAGSFLSSSDATLHFGLGAARAVDELTVVWPDGREERFQGLEAGRRYTVHEAADGGPARLEVDAPH